MVKIDKEKKVSLKESLHEIEKILDKTDPEKDKGVILSKKDEILCLLYKKENYETLLQKTDFAKTNYVVSDAEDIFQKCIIEFLKWFDRKYLEIDADQSDAAEEADQADEVSEDEAARALAEIFDPKEKKKTEEVREEPGNHNHIYNYLLSLLRKRPIDEYRKGHWEKRQSLEGMLKDQNGKQSDHNAVLSAGERYQPEQTLIRWRSTNAQYDTMLIDIVSQIISLYSSTERLKKSGQKLTMNRIFFSRDVMRVMHNFDTMPAFEHGQEIGKNTKEPFVNFCLQKHVSFKEDGKYVLGGIFMNPYKSYQDLITEKARLELQKKDNIWNMDKNGIPNTVIEGYFEKCCNTAFTKSKITYYYKIYEEYYKHGVEAAAAAE